MHEKKQPPEFIIGRSWSLAHQNKHKEALEDLLSISEKDRGSRWSIAYSNFLFNLGETEKAIKHLEFVLKFEENLNIKENERNTPLTTKNHKLYAALAQNYLIVSREKEALYIFRKRADLLYRLDDPQQNLPNQTYILATAELALKIGKNNLAITYFNKLRANPGNSHAKLFKIPPLKPIEERRNDAFPVARLFGLALAHERIGEITQSFFYYAELLQRYPYHQKGLKNFYKMIKHYEVVEGVSVRKEGLELLYELAEKYPQQSFLQTIMAKLAQDMDLKKAHLEKLKVKFPYQNEIEYSLAKVCRNRRDYQDALDYALSYQQKNPDLHQEKIRSITTSTLQIAIDPQLQDCLQRFPKTKSYVVGPSAHACLEQNPLNKVNIVVNATHQSFLLHGLSPCPYKENLYNTYVNGLHVNYYFSPVSEESTQKFLLEDALTRDFTFNCLYIDAQGVVHDPLLGLALKHYRQSILSTPIPADKSFQEDPARLLHALAAIIYGYTPTDEVWEALHSWQACGILNRGNFKAILRKDLHSFNEEQTEKYLDLLRSTNLAQKLFNVPSSLVSYETVNYVAQNYKRKLEFFESKPLRSCIKVEPHPNCYYDEKYSQLILERIKNSPFI